MHEVMSTCSLVLQQEMVTLETEPWHDDLKPVVAGVVSRVTLLSLSLEC